MDLLEIEEKEKLSREGAAQRLRAIADALERHNGLRLQRGGVTLDVRVADAVLFELEVDVEANESSIDIEISW